MRLQRNCRLENSNYAVLRQCGPLAYGDPVMGGKIVSPGECAEQISPAPPRAGLTERQSGLNSRLNSKLIVDIADYVVTNDPSTALITYSLGSCIGVTAWDPETHVGAMIHFMLPDSALSPDKAKANPAMFANSGIPRMFKEAYQMGASKRRMIVKVAGGSQLLDDSGTFNIGKRNYVMLRKLFWKNNILINSEDVGGSKSRTISLSIATGTVTMKTRDGEVEL